MKSNYYNLFENQFNFSIEDVASLFNLLNPMKAELLNV